ncbi:hypothetical protein HPB50_029602 [Hyalomma asiaticum]|nr:hypothetical protein HPB50_029602 [Hyalomma asiaticum]
MGCYNPRLETRFSALSPGSSSAGVTELSASRPPSMGDRLGVPPQSHSRFLWRTNPGATTPERPFRWHLPPTPDGSVPALAPEEASMFPDERPCRWRRYHANGPSSRLCGGALGLARMSTPRRLGSQKTEKQPLTAEVQALMRQKEATIERYRACVATLRDEMQHQSRKLSAEAHDLRAKLLSTTSTREKSEQDGDDEAKEKPRHFQQKLDQLRALDEAHREAVRILLLEAAKLTPASAPAMQTARASNFERPASPVGYGNIHELSDGR